MKNKSLALVIILFVAACTCNNRGDDLPVSDSVTLVLPDSILVYDVDVEEKTFNRHEEIPADSLTLQRVVNGLLQKYPEVKIVIERLSNDTLYITMPDKGEYLGERMGSTGSSTWITEAVVNLTAVKGINYVKLGIEEHSHASPQVLGRSDFMDFKEVK